MTNRTSVLLIPGFMLDESLWDSVAPLFPDDWNILRANLKQGETMTEIAQYIVQSAPARFVLIGFSLGGYIARSIVEQYPSRVSALILIASSLQVDTKAGQADKRAAIELVSQESFKGLSTQAIKRSLHPKKVHNDALIKIIQDMGRALGYTQFVKQSCLDRRLYETSKITCPTLVIAAGQDQLRSREEVFELHRGILDSHFEVIENSGHMIPLEAPEVLVTLILSWLQDHDFENLS